MDFINIIYVSYSESELIKRSISFIEPSSFIKIHIFETVDLYHSISVYKDFIQKGFNIEVYSSSKYDYLELHWFNILTNYKFKNILLLCADEVLQLNKDEQMSILKHDVVSFGRANMINGYQLKGGGWGVDQDIQYRFFKNPVLLKFSPQPHILPFTLKNCSILKSELFIIHYTYFNLSDFIIRFDRYTNLESKLLTNDQNYSNSYILYRSIKHFLRRFVIQKGFKDNLIGLVLCLLMSLFFAVSVLKFKEVE
jgi:hypothetical protein